MQLAGVVVAVVLSVLFSASTVDCGACVSVYITTNVTNGITYGSMAVSTGELFSVTSNQGRGLYAGLGNINQTGWFVDPILYAPGCVNANAPYLTQLLRYYNGAGAHWYTTTALNEKVPAGFTVDNNFKACCFDPMHGFGLSTISASDAVNCGPAPGQNSFTDPVFRYSTKQGDYLATTTVNPPYSNGYRLMTATGSQTAVANGGNILCYAIAVAQTQQSQV